MESLVLRPWAGTPRQWVLVFDRRAATWWMNKLPIGRYRHVRAFGYVPEARAWIFLDDSMDRMTAQIACEQAARQIIAEWLTGSEAIAMPARTRTSTVPRLGVGCVRTAKHLIGLRSGALRPDALWRDCLANGGEIIANEVTPTAAAGHDTARPATATG